MRRLPRVVLVGQLPPPRNGMSVTTETLLRSSLGNRFELIHLDTSDHRDIANVARLDLRNIVLALGQAMRFGALLALRRPDVVYLPIARNRLGVLRDLLFLLPARLARRRVAVHLHACSFVDYWYGETWWMRVLVRLAFGPSTHAFVLGDDLRGAFGPLVALERVHVVPNGIDDVGVGAPADARAPIVLHLSTLWSEKGLDEVLEVVRRVHEHEPSARFVFAGPWYSQAERRAADARLRADGTAGVVAFSGPVAGEAKERLLQSAALVLLPFRFEGQPLVVLEALAAGTPIVATRVGAVPETVDEGIEALLAEPRDVDALAKATKRLLREPELRRRLGVAGRARFEAEFTAERFAARVGDALARVLRADAERTTEHTSRAARVRS